MRLRSVLVAVFCLAAAVGRGETECGVKAGACLAQRTYSYLSYSGPGSPTGVTLRHVREGATAGVFGHWSGSSGLGLMAEVQYVQKGIVGVDGEHVNCMSFPMLPRYDVRVWRGRMYVAAGPRLDMYLLSDEPGGHLGTVEVGGDVVLGYRLGRVSVETRYSGAPEYDAPPGGASSSGDVFQVLLGWTLWSNGQQHVRGVSEPPNSYEASSRQ